MSDDLVALRTAQREPEGWRSMDSAPKDGTFIEVVGRYPGASAGFPQYAAWRADLTPAGWYHHSRHEPDHIIAWAWRPRTAWPNEPAPSSPGGA